MLRGKFPDLTPAQLVAAFFGALYPVLVLVGVDLNKETQDALEELKWLALGLFGADAAIRVGRNVGRNGPQADAEPQQVMVSVTEADKAAPTEEELTDTYEGEPPVDSTPEGAVADKFGERGHAHNS